jgi:hypothetical protein
MTHSPVLFTLQSGHESMRLTPAIIYVILTALAAVPFIIKNYRNLGSKKLLTALVIVLANLAYVILSLLWTTDVLRGLVNVGSLAALTLVFAGALCVKRWKKIFPALVRILIIASVFWCIVAWFQFWSGLFYPEFLNGFCNSCSAVGFGFVRPAGLTFEPQIFGNLLLAPTIISAYLILKTPKVSKVLYIVFAFFVITLLITLSRGAIYALVIGIVVLLLAVRPKWSLVIRVALVGIISLVISTTFQGLAIQLNPNVSGSFGDGVRVVVEQLTLGRIKLATPSANDGPTDLASPEPEPPVDAPIYTGYVPISTNHRLSLTEKALDVWRRNPSTMVFGTGAGSGARPIAGDYDTVQNQHVEILLNYGLVGFALYAGAIFGLFYVSRRQKFLWAILAAYLFQWAFFSGLPHGFFHVYFVLMGCFIYATLPRVQSKPDQPSETRSEYRGRTTNAGHNKHQVCAADPTASRAGRQFAPNR